MESTIQVQKVAQIACRGNLGNAQKKGYFFWEVFPFATRGNAKMY